MIMRFKHLHGAGADGLRGTPCREFGCSVSAPSGATPTDNNYTCEFVPQMRTIFGASGQNGNRAIFRRAMGV
jgi:hypothetical protein